MLDPIHTHRQKILWRLQTLVIMFTFVRASLVTIALGKHRYDWIDRWDKLFSMINEKHHYDSHIAICFVIFLVFIVYLNEFTLSFSKRGRKVIDLIREQIIVNYDDLMDSNENLFRRLFQAKSWTSWAELKQTRILIRDLIWQSKVCDRNNFVHLHKPLRWFPFIKRQTRTRLFGIQMMCECYFCGQYTIGGKFNCDPTGH